MNVRIVHIELTKARDAVLDARLAEHAEGAIVEDSIVEGDLGARHRQTATPGCPTSEKPRVIEVGKSVDTSLSATLAGREAMRCRL